MSQMVDQVNGYDVYSKRAECDEDGNNIKTTYATKAELPDGVPGVTSSDDGKVLKAAYSGGVGSYAWGTESSAIVDQTYNASSTNAQSGTAVAGAIAAIDTSIFIAIYGTTTYAQTMNAYNNGKLVFCKTSDNKILPLYYVGAYGLDFIGLCEDSQENMKLQRVNISEFQGWYTENYSEWYQADWNESNNTLISYIRNKPTLATVATSGDYDDLTNKPTIPAAQVQADWSESDTTDVSYIQNKPEDYDLVAGSNVTITKNDNDKEITVAASFTQAQADWSQSDSSAADYIKNKPTIPTVPTTDQTYNSSSTNPQSGTAVAGAIATVRQVPSSTSSDEGKVLTVDSNGDTTWEIFDGGIYKVIYNSTATNTITSSVNLYSCDEIRLFFSIGGMEREVSISLKDQSGTIQRVIKTYGRGDETGNCNERWIQITFTSNSITLNATKRYQIGSVDDSTTTFSNVATSSATSSLMLLSRVVGVKYISGGAIQIEDAPSNGKAYVRKDGAWVESSSAVETVLWSGSYTGTIEDTNYITLSESLSHFQRFKIVIGGTNQYTYHRCFEFESDAVNLCLDQTYPTGTDATANYSRLEVNAAGTTITRKIFTQVKWTSSGNTITNKTSVTASNGEVVITKVIGINRIANN